MCFPTSSLEKRVIQDYHSSRPWHARDTNVQRGSSGSSSVIESDLHWVVQWREAGRHGNCLTIEIVKCWTPPLITFVMSQWNTITLKDAATYDTSTVTAAKAPQRHGYVFFVICMCNTDICWLR